MKILIVNSVCGIRSTGRICTDLAKHWKQEGHIVAIAYGREYSPDNYDGIVYRIGCKLNNSVHGIIARCFDADGRGSILATKQFIKWIEAFDPDVINLHNIHGYYINYEILLKYMSKKNKRVIWTFHDMWPITGHGCSCEAMGCSKWLEGCKTCPGRNYYPLSYIDRAHRNYIRKKELINSLENLTIVAPSEWLSKIVKKSFLGEKNITVIHNGVDLKKFHHVDNTLKEKYGLEGKTVLMGCTTWWTKEKGLEDFIKLSNLVDERFRIVLVGIDKEQKDKLPDKILAIERTNNVDELVELYSMADLFLNLTYADNYPTVNLEALACGTPVITYKTGGSAECLNKGNGKSFRKGDLDSVVYFLNNSYSTDSFSITSTDFLSKETAFAAYSDLLR